MSIKVMLQKLASGVNYSLECGLADDIKNFDHHRPEHNHYPCPANNKRIPVLQQRFDSSVEISHMDADTYIGLLRFMGKNIPSIDFELLEKIDLNGSSVVDDKTNNETYHYMVGVGEMSKYVQFPRCGDEPQDVTSYVLAMMEAPAAHLISLGEKAHQRSEDVYRDTMVHSGFSDVYNTNVAFFVIGAEQPLDPSRAYEDDYGIVFVYRKHYKTISIYANPTNKLTFAGTSFHTMDGFGEEYSVLGRRINFGGHPKACGSDRGVDYSLLDATLLVFNVFFS